MDFIVEIESRDTLLALEPDQDALKSTKTRGVIVTTKGDGAPYDFHSRFFAPAAGVPEDPVTGSAHCCLGPYWSKRLNKTRFFAHQDSERGGELRVTVAGERVLLEGRAKTIYFADVVRRWQAL